MRPIDYISDKERWISPKDSALQYTGRIDFDDPLAPVFVYPYTSVRMRFTGPSVKILLKNRRECWNSTLGFVIDGKQGSVRIPEDDKPVCITLAEGLEKGEHDLFFFKRMDSCHMFYFYGFAVDRDAMVTAPEEKPERKIEVFGDSVSAGEVSEAVDYVGKPDPEHHGEYSNSYYSYAAMTARKLNAQLHNTAQGGIALLHRTGWFGAPELMGMEEMWDKIEYSPAFGITKRWDFSRYTPNVVVVAIGQNDSHPDDYMKEDYNGERAETWRRHYESLIRLLRETYPSALIVLSTTILEHDGNWDRSIQEVCERLKDPAVVHFRYSRNGCGTPGHIRIPEAEEMSSELSAFIKSFGESIWE